VSPTISLRPLLSPAGRNQPAPYYAELHRLGAAAALEPEDRHAAVVFGHEAVGRVLRDPGFRVLDANYLDGTGMNWRDHPVLRVLQNSVFNSPAEEHARMRRPFSQALSARRVAETEPLIERLTAERLDRLAGLLARGEPVDFMAEFAVPLPADVIGEILAVPTTDRHRFPDLVRTFDAVLELGQRSYREILAADRAALELSAYFAKLLAAREAQPRDDLVSALARARSEEPGGTDELLANLIVFFNAGFRTTANLFGNGLALLLAHPEAADALRADPSRAPQYVEEILRLEPPVHFAIRYAAADTEVGGVSVAKGRSVVILTAAANRDPSRFPDPDRFDPTRTDSQHYAFSAGPHYCLGQVLGRTEGRIVFPRVLSRFPTLAPAAAPEPLRNLMLRGPARLPVLLTP
jgi:cytochrome P450